jgi:hypothetical protein
LQCIAERRCISKRRATAEIIAEDERQDGVLAPPVLCQDRRSPGCGPWIGNQEELQGIVHAPHRHPIEMGEYLISRGGSILSLGERREGDTSEHPISSQRILQHGFQRY